MPPGSDTLLNTAAGTGRWEAVAVCLILIACIAGLAYLVRVWMHQSYAREKEMLAWRTEMEKFVRTELTKTLEETKKSLDTHTGVMERLFQEFKGRPCQLSPSVLAKIAEYVASHPGIAAEVRQ